MCFIIYVMLINQNLHPQTKKLKNNNNNHSNNNNDNQKNFIHTFLGITQSH